MSSPDPAAPPPKPEGKGFRSACLGFLGVVRFGGFSIGALGGFLGKRELEAMTPAQRAAMEAKRNAELDASEAARLAPTLAEGAQAQARLAKAAQAVAAADALQAKPCPPEVVQSTPIPVDAEWFRALAGGLPKEKIGTPWFRHQAFTDLADDPFGSYITAENTAYATIRADKDAANAGYVAVIHTTALQLPKLIDKSSFEGGRFDGFVQVIRYPAGTSECIAKLHAESSEKIGGGIGIGLRVRGIRIPITGAMPKEEPQKQIEEDFQGHFWEAEEAALGK